MARLSLTAAGAAAKAGAVVVGIYQGERGADGAGAGARRLRGRGAPDGGSSGPLPGPGFAAVDDALDGQLLAALRALGATGAQGEVTRLATFGALDAPVVAAVGLGTAPTDGSGPDVDVLRRAAGDAARSLAGTESAALLLTADDESSAGDALRAVAEGALLGAYDFRRYRHASLPDHPAPLGTVQVLVPDPKDRAARAAARRAEALAAAVALARDLVNTPPNDLHPADLAAAAETAAAQAGLDVEVLDEKALRKGGFGGILGVGSGSAHPPRLVRIGYRPRRARTSVALVGKGITFDSGGLSLKPAAAMEWMKSDMGGAAAVVASMTAIAALKPDVAVTAWVPIAENMPSGTAIRPGDVLTMRSGKRVEVVNTDAEGRLILGDAIARACEDGPAHLIEMSTLTGAQIVALGLRRSGVMGSDGMRERLVAASARTGEAMWPMPLPDDVRASFDSDVADFANLGDRMGGMLAAGLFLREFVAEGVDWAHIDIAGPSFNQHEPWGYTPKGATGVPVRTVVEVVEQLAR